MGHKLRRLAALMIAVSVIAAGAGLGGMGVSHSGGHGLHVMVSAPDAAPTVHHGGHNGHSEAKAEKTAEMMDCHGGIGGKTGDPTGKTSGCCHSVFAPSLLGGEAPGAAVVAFDGEKILPPADRSARSHTPEGEFRPPRPRSAPEPMN